MRISVLLYASVLIGFGCTKNSEDAALTEMLFQVNPDLISHKVEFNTLGFSLHPPAGWQPVPDSTFEKFRSRIGPADPDAVLQIKPVALFINHETQNVFSVSQIDVSGEINLSQIADMVEKQVAFDQGGRKVKRHRFLKEDLIIEQLFMQDLLYVVVKLLFETPKGFVQLDYTCRKSEYEKESKAIESSIGTIMSNKNLGGAHV
jgi:hypothetical protein